MPSSFYFGIAAGALALSLALQVTGRGKWRNAIAPCVPLGLMVGLYHKVVNSEARHQADGSRNRGYTS